MADKGKAQYKAMRERWKIVAETHQPPLHRVLIVFMQNTATIAELKGGSLWESYPKPAVHCLCNCPSIVWQITTRWRSMDCAVFVGEISARYRLAFGQPVECSALYTLADKAERQLVFDDYRLSGVPRSMLRR